MPHGGYEYFTGRQGANEADGDAPVESEGAKDGFYSLADAGGNGVVGGVFDGLYVI